MIIGGLLAASVAWMSLSAAPLGWLLVLRLGIYVSLVVSGLGALLTFFRRRRALRGLGYGRFQGNSVLVIAILLLVAFFTALWPFSFPYAWFGNVVILVSVARAGGDRVLRC